KINGVTVSPTIVSNATGADVSYALSPLPPTGTVITNTLIFSDSDNISQTNVWSWTLTYAFLPGSSSLPVTALSVRGWHHRTAWTYNGGVGVGDSVARAEQQLAVPPQIPLDIYYETNMNTT